VAERVEHETEEAALEVEVVVAGWAFVKHLAEEVVDVPSPTMPHSMNTSVPTFSSAAPPRMLLAAAAENKKDESYRSECTSEI